MNIRSIEQVNALGCCPCPLPSCTPRKECESVNVPICGFTLAEDSPVQNETVGEEEENDILYVSRITTGNITNDFAYTYSETTYNYTDTKDPLNDCAIVKNGSGSESTTYYFDEEKTEVSSTSVRTWTITNGVYNGSETVIIYDEDGEITEEYTEPFEYGDPLGENFDYNTTPVLTGSTLTFDGYDTAISSSADYQGPHTIEFTPAMTPEVAADSVNLAAEEFEDEDFIGTDCISSLNVEYASDETRILDGDATVSRYRFAPPEDFGGSTWEMEWDEIQATDEWWTWFDNGATGTEPTPGPTLLAHQTWDWNGTDEWSEWFILPVPSVIGETRVANGLVTCWRSARIGSKPSAFGIEVALPE